MGRVPGLLEAESIPCDPLAAQVFRPFNVTLEGGERTGKVLGGGDVTNVQELGIGGRSLPAVPRSRRQRGRAAVRHDAGMQSRPVLELMNQPAAGIAAGVW